MYAELGGFLVDHRRLDYVQDVLFRADKVKPGLPEVHYNLARYYRIVQSPSDEKKALDHVLRLLKDTDPLTRRRLTIEIDTHTRLGEYYTRIKEYITAEKELQTAIRLVEQNQRMKLIDRDSVFGRPYADLGDLSYYIQGDLVAAATAYQTAIDNTYVGPELTYKIGYIQYVGQNFKDALASFTTAEDTSAYPSVTDVMAPAATVPGGISAAATVPGGISAAATVPGGISAAATVPGGAAATGAGTPAAAEPAGHHGQRERLPRSPARAHAHGWPGAREPPVRPWQLLLPAGRLFRGTGILPSAEGPPGDQEGGGRNAAAGSEAGRPRAPSVPRPRVQQPRRHDDQDFSEDGRPEPEIAGHGRAHHRLGDRRFALQVHKHARTGRRPFRRNETRSVPSLNMRGILYPVTGLVPQIYQPIPKDFEATGW